MSPKHLCHRSGLHRIYHVENSASKLDKLFHQHETGCQMTACVSEMQ